MSGRTAAAVSIFCDVSVSRASHRLFLLATPLLQWEAPDDRIVTFSLAFM